MPHRVVFEIAYAGNRTLHLINSFSPQNINALPVGSLFKPYDASKRPDIPTTQAAAGNAVPFQGEQFPLFVAANSKNNTSLQNLSQAVTDSFRPYPLYNQVNAEAHTAYANYNGLQTQIAMDGSYGRIGANYTWSKALGAVAGGDPTNIRNDYTITNYSRKNIFNLTYTALTGKLVKDRAIGWATNGWELSGYAGYQSGPNMPSTFGNNFGAGGTLTLPTGSTALLPGQSMASTCTANPCTIGVSDTYFLGTPDVSLQPTLTSSPQGCGNHVYAKATAFGLPALGTNGSFHLGYFPGPAFFDADLSATRNFSFGDHGNISLRVAAFNFINHPNISFSGLDTTATQLNYTQTVNGGSVNSAIANAVNDNVNFGTANFAAGRRIMELSLRYSF